MFIYPIGSGDSAVARSARIQLAMRADCLGLAASLLAERLRRHRVTAIYRPLPATVLDVKVVTMALQLPPRRIDRVWPSEYNPVVVRLPIEAGCHPGVQYGVGRLIDELV